MSKMKLKTKVSSTKNNPMHELEIERGWNEKLPSDHFFMLILFHFCFHIIMQENGIKKLADRDSFESKIFNDFLNPI